MIKVGDRVRIIGGDLYLGKWIRAGTEGNVVGDMTRSPLLGECLYQVKIDGKVYYLVPAEFEVIRRAGQTIVIEDDGEID